MPFRHLIYGAFVSVVKRWRVADIATFLVLLIHMVPVSGAPFTGAATKTIQPLEVDSGELEPPAFALGASGPWKRHLEVTMNQKPYRLEVMEEAPRGIPPAGGWPLVLITHGAPGAYTPPSQIGPDLHRHWLSFFAARGYYTVAVARRGFATSEGKRQAEGGTCSQPNPEGYLLEQARDLEATIESVRRHRPVDPDTVLVVGHSAGGVAALALNQRVVGLRGIINVAGGLYRIDDLDTFNPENVFEGCESYRTALVDAVGKFADQQVTPSLWLYSENDDFFTPALARSMVDAWNSQSVFETAAILRLLPASNESHKDFIRSKRVHDIAESINAFLLTEGLPGEPDDLQQRLEACLNETLHPSLNEYLQEPLHRALAVSREHDWLFWNDDSVALEAAAIESLSHCRAVTGDGCELLAWDTHMADAICANTR